MTDPIVQPLNPDSPPRLPRRPAPMRDFTSVYRQHHGFVWRTLRHLGVDHDRVDDAVQDTFLVVHRRLGEFEGRAALTTWLFEIARRVAARHRRIAAREASRHSVLPELPGAVRLDDHLERAEAAEILQMFLEELDRDKSVVFVLAELEQWQVTEIADSLQLNVNTVHARLRAARKLLDRLVRRLQARDQRRRFRNGSELLAAVVLPVAPPVPLDEFVAGSAVDHLPASELEWTELADGRLTDAVVGATKLGAAGGSTKLALAGVSLAAVLGGVVIAAVPRPPSGPAASEPAAPASVANDEPTPAVSRAADSAETVALAPEERPPATSPGEPARERRAAAHAPRRGERVDDAAALTAELATIEAARAALLAGDAREALARIADHRRRFPDGALAEEAAATRIESLCLLGERDRARREADAFARRWPGSSLAARVESLCAP